MEDFKLRSNYRGHNYSLWAVNILEVLSFALFAATIKYMVSYQIGANLDGNIEPLKLAVFMESILPMAVIVTPILGYLSDKFGRIPLLKFAVACCGFGYLCLAIMYYFDWQYSLLTIVLLALLSARYSIFILSISSLCDRHTGRYRYIWIVNIFSVYLLSRTFAALAQTIIHKNTYLSTNDQIILMSFIATLLMFISFFILKFFCQNDAKEKQTWKNGLKNFNLKLLVSCLKILQIKSTSRILILYAFFYMTLSFMSYLIPHVGNEQLKSQVSDATIIMVLINLLSIVVFIIIYPKLITYFSIFKALLFSLILYLGIFIFFIFKAYIDMNQIAAVAIGFTVTMLAMFIAVSYLIGLCDAVKPRYIGLLLGINYIFIKISFSAAWLLATFTRLNLLSLTLSVLLILIQIYWLHRKKSL